MILAFHDKKYQKYDETEDWNKANQEPPTTFSKVV